MKGAGGRPLRVKMISPAKTAADSRYWRSIKYSLFPPLGLATLAGYLDPDDEIDLQDEHVETLRLDDEPDLVVIEAYITSAGRAYRYADHYRARGAYVCLGGLHPTSLPEEAARHADSVFCGPGEDTWPAFLRDFRAGRPKPLYRSTERTLAGMPPARRDLIKRERYLVPNSLVVSRGCPHLCDFCYKEAFFRGGKSFYVQAVDDALAEIDRLPGRHLYFLDDNLFGSPPFAEALFDGLKGMGRLWQAAGTVEAVLRPGLLEKAVESGLRSLFIGFETLSEANLLGAGKTQNLAGAGPAWARRGLRRAALRRRRPPPPRPRGDGQRRLRLRHGRGRHVRLPAHRGVGREPGHRDGDLPHHDALPRHAAGAAARGRGPHHEPRLGPLRHPPRRVRAGAHDGGGARVRLLGRAYREFYRWRNIWRASFAHGDLREHARHLAYTSGWKKLEPMWDWAIRSGQVHRFLPLLEAVLDRFVPAAPTRCAPASRRLARSASRPPAPPRRAALEHAGRAARRLHVERVALDQTPEGPRLRAVGLAGGDAADHEQVAPARVPLRVARLAVPLLHERLQDREHMVERLLELRRVTAERHRREEDDEVAVRPALGHRAPVVAHASSTKHCTRSCRRAPVDGPAGGMPARPGAAGTGAERGRPAERRTSLARPTRWRLNDGRRRYTPGRLCPR